MNSMYYANSSYEVFENKNGDCFIKDVDKNKYYFKSKYNISNRINFPISQRVKWSVRDTFYTTMVICSILMFIHLIFNFSIIFSPKHIEMQEYIATIIYLIGNLTIHELSHQFTLIFFGRKKGKFKFKFYYIFPTFLIDTSDTYLLPRYRRLFVYYAGVMSEIFICYITFIFYPEKTFLLVPVIFMILFNLIPLGGIKTDGYHILVSTILGVNDFKQTPSILNKIGKYLFIVVSLSVFILSILNLLR